VGLGEYVQVFRGMFVKIGIAFPSGEGKSVGAPRFKFNLEQTTEYYTPFNEQHSDTTCRQVGLF
jgi:hypothetical protein